MTSTRKICIPLFTILLLLIVNKESLGLEADSSGYAEINNVKLYYEITGSGKPLLYMHGGLSSSLDFSEYIPEFSKEYMVITFDRRGHGRSYDNGDPFSYSAMGETANSLLEYLGIESAYVIGWSDGGVVGFHLASKHPSKVKKLIAVGANYLVTGLTDESVEWIKTQLTPESISQSFPQVEQGFKSMNPNPENFANFINKSREMWLTDPYIPKEELVKIEIPVLLAAGDTDSIKLEHTAEMRSLLSNSRLCILPNTSHFVFALKNEIVIKIFNNFLQE